MIDSWRNRPDCGYEPARAVPNPAPPARASGAPGAGRKASHRAIR